MIKMENALEFYKSKDLSNNEKFKVKALNFLYANRWSDKLLLPDELNLMLDKWTYGEFTVDEVFNAAMNLVTDKTWMEVIRAVVPRFMAVVKWIDGLKGFGKKFVIGSLVAGVIFNIVADIFLLLYLFL
jgi:hypothetical protein